MRESQERYRHIIEDQTELICRYRADGRISFVNGAYARYYGKKRAELIDRNFVPHLPEPDRTMIAARLAGITRENPVVVIEHRIVTPAGDIRWQRWTHRGVYRADGTLVEYQAVGNDITAHKYREDERELTARLIVLLTTPGDFRARLAELTAALQGWSGCEAVGIRLRAGDDFPYFETRGFSPAFVQAESRLCARGPDGEILRDGAGQPVLECMCGEVLSGRFDPAQPHFTARGSFWSNSTSALLAGLAVADRPARSRNRCMSEGYESVALIALRCGDQVFGLLQFNDRHPDCFTPDLIGNFEGMADSLALALSRRQAEEALRESEAKLDFALRAAQVGVWEWDIAADRCSFDDQACRLLGLDPANFRGTAAGFFAAVHPADYGRLKTAMARTVAQDVPYDPEYRAVWPDGSIHHISARGRLTGGAAGGARKISGIIWDVTGRKRLEQTLLDKNEELERFTHTVSHDLRSPLTTIMGFAEAGLMDLQAGRSDRLARNLNRIVAAAEKMAARIHDLLELSRLGCVVNQPETVALGELVREAQALLAGMLAARRVELAAAPDLPVVTADRQRLVSVLQNLIENAAKYMGDQPQPRIDIGWRGDGPDRVFWVRDNGIGIEEKYQQRVFELFDQLDPAAEGTGIGLAVVRRIIAAHGGRVWLESAGAGRGCTFYFTLPNPPAVRD